MTIMKHFKIVFILCISILFWACDKVENPVEAKAPGYNTSFFPGDYVNDYPYPSFTTNATPNRLVLLEDYTGHKCGNCPDAAEEAKNIEDNNAGQVVVVSVHAGQGGVSNFQKWNKEGDFGYPMYSRNFTNEDGLRYAVEIDGGCPANPTGMVSRLPYGSSNSLWLGYPTWSQAVNEIITNNNSVTVDIQLAVNYYPETNGLFVHTYADTKSALDDSYSVVLMLIDKEVIDWQKDYSLVDDNIEDYHHHNVHLRNLNGTYGQEVFAAGTAAGESIQNDATFKISEEEYDDDLAIVAFVQNNTTLEVVQVAIADVTP